ncbi:MotA/TolQ/ExbB proton channel family protein [Psychroserpens sp.]
MTRTYKEESYKDLFKVSSAQKIALRLGILGTFVGLILAFVSLEDINQMDQNFSKITNALQYSFSTSIAGLQVSIFLALFTLLLNKRLETYFKLMEDAAQTAISLSRNSINKDAFLVSFDQMKTSLEDGLATKKRTIS